MSLSLLESESSEEKLSQIVTLSKKIKSVYDQNGSPAEVVTSTQLVLLHNLFNTSFSSPSKFHLPNLFQDK